MASNVFASEPASPPRSVAPAALGGAADQPPHLALIEMAAAIWKARAVYAAARLELADLIGDGRRTVEELAHATGTHVPSLRRLLRALASCGVLTEVEPARFALTPLGAALRTGAPGAARATVLTLGGDWQWQAWGRFLHSLQTGQPAMGEAFGCGVFDYLTANPQDGAHFNEAMVGMHGADGPAVVKAYDFSSLRAVVDLGGGTGMLLTTILQANPHLRGMVVELPETVPQARQLIECRGLSNRCDAVAGDFFKHVPPGHD